MGLLSNTHPYRESGISVTHAWSDTGSRTLTQRLCMSQHQNTQKTGRNVLLGEDRSTHSPVLRGRQVIGLVFPYCGVKSEAPSFLQEDYRGAEGGPPVHKGQLFPPRSDEVAIDGGDGLLREEGKPHLY